MIHSGKLKVLTLWRAPLAFLSVMVILNTGQSAETDKAEIPEKSDSLFSYQINQDNQSIDYTYGHTMTMPPEILGAVVRKGYTKLHQILTKDGQADTHALDLFVDYNNHNPYYFKNGMTATNFYSWLSSFVVSPSVSSDLQVQARVETFVCLVWALVDLSWFQGDKFNRGAIIIQDKDGRLHDYLEQLTLYCAGVNDSANLNDGVYTLFGSNIGYNRYGKSSHFVGRQISHYGFDARFEPESFALPILPFFMTHILFGRCQTHTGERITFIKPEEAGLADIRSLVYHAYNLFAPISDAQILRRERDIPRPIAESFYSLIKGLQPNLVEFKDLEVNQKLQNLFDLDAAGQLSVSYFSSTKHCDIAWMIQISEELLKNSTLPTAVHVQIGSLLSDIEKQFCLDSVPLRSGCEVLFSDEDLVSKVLAKLTEIPKDITVNDGAVERPELSC